MSNEVKIFKDKLRFGVCDNCGHTGANMHTCPYAEDIHSDSREICNCCHDCTYNCAQEI